MSTKGSQREDHGRGRIREFLPHPLFEPVRPAQRRLNAAKLIEPWLHGDGCFGLSGLYAPVNAVRLALAPHRELSFRETERLVEAALSFIETHGSLAKASALGLRFQLWSRLVEALSVTAHRETSIPLSVEQPFLGARTINREETFKILETLVLRQCVSAIMRRGGLYSLVSGYTPSSLLLIDASGGRWIARNACASPMETRTRHCLLPWSITVFSS